MSVSCKQLDYAIKNAAPLLPQTDGSWGYPANYNVSITTDFNPHAPDDAPLYLNAPTKLPPSCVVAETSAEAYDYVKTYHDKVKEPFDSSYAHEQVTHEFEHNIGALLLGAKNTRVVLQLSRIPGTDLRAWQLNALPYSLMTTKLGAAVCSAYPKEPSPADLNQIARMGYKSVDDVAMRAAKSGLLIPLSTQNIG
jgi:hypothetical protein